MVRLETVKRGHHCYSCDNFLSEYGSMRVNFHGHNYCIPCGYFEIKKYVDELERFQRELTEKYGKKIVVARLKM